MSGEAELLDLNQQVAAQQLADYAKCALHRNIPTVVYNRFDSDEAIYYLVPQRVDPAYQCGNFSLRAAPFEDAIFAGICFEKGYGDACRSSVKANEVMGESWIWHKFIAALASGQIATQANDIQRHLCAPLAVLVTAHTFHERHDMHRLQFTMDGAELELQDADAGRTNWLPGAELARSPTDLAIVFNAAPHLDWTWITVEFGVISGPGTGIRWRVEDVFDRICRPFLDWFE